MSFLEFFRRHTGWCASIVLSAATLLVYLNSFPGAFIFDDEETIVLNPHIKSLWPIWESMKAPPEISLRDRPIVSLTLAINYALGGLRVGGYHAFNLTIHILAALALFGIARRTFSGPRLQERYGPSATGLAFTVALLWSVNPLQTESVTYIIQRSESLCGLFYLLTIYCFIRAAGSRTRNVLPQRSDNRTIAEVFRFPWRSKDRHFDLEANLWYGASLFFCVLGMGTKAVMVTAPLMVLAYDAIFVSRSIRLAWKNRRGFYLSLSATWLIQLALIINTSYPDITTHSPLQYAISQFSVIVHYLKLAFWPHPLCLDYAWEVPKSIGEVAPPAVLIIGLLAATVWALFKKPALGFVGLWFFLILAPTSSILPLEDLTFEHRMYLPLAAVLVLITVGGYELLSRFFYSEKGIRKIVQFCLVFMISLVLGMTTVARNRVYHSSVAMWSDVAAKRPLNSRAYNNLGNALLARGKAAEAIASYRTTIKLNPRNYETHLNWAVALIKLGKLSEAIAQCREALNLNSSFGEAHLKWGIALFKMGKTEEAISHFERAAQLDPDNPGAYLNLGTALADRGIWDAALDNFNRALKIDPYLAEAHSNAAYALIQMNRIPEAIFHGERAIRLDPRLAEAYDNLGIAFFIEGKFRESAEAYLQFLSFHPDNPTTLHNIGKALAAGGNSDEAIMMFKRAIEVKPEFPEAYASLGQALFRQGQFEEGLRCLRRALELNPVDETGYENLARSLQELGRYRDVIQTWEAGLAHFPDQPLFLNNLSWLLSTCPDAGLRDCSRAIALAQQADLLTKGENPAILDSLATAYAACGQFDRAIETARQAIMLAQQAHDEKLKREIRTRLDLYQTGRPYHGSID